MPLAIWSIMSTAIGRGGGVRFFWAENSLTWVYRFLLISSVTRKHSVFSSSLKPQRKCKMFGWEREDNRDISGIRGSISPLMCRRTKLSPNQEISLCCPPLPSLLLTW
uniref:Uncharacterized protein n=1 Tax=Opuntia streptacantha TaxID=393608 RepID=A0A7C9EG10_OPUST